VNRILFDSLKLGDGVEVDVKGGEEPGKVVYTEDEVYQILAEAKKKKLTSENEFLT
jgi:hypothetical protein